MNNKDEHEMWCALNAIEVNEAFAVLGCTCSKAKINCIRCNDNGCPACDGTKGSSLNPDGY